MPAVTVAQHQITIPAAVVVVHLPLVLTELQPWAEMVVPVYLLQLLEQEPQEAAAAAAQHIKAEPVALVALAVAEMLALPEQTGMVTQAP